MHLGYFQKKNSAHFEFYIYIFEEKIYLGIFPYKTPFLPFNRSFIMAKQIFQELKTKNMQRYDMAPFLPVLFNILKLKSFE